MIKVDPSNCKVSTSEIKNDIEATEQEVLNLKTKLNILILDRSGNKVEIYMTEGRIKLRKDFITYLNGILEYRKLHNI